MKRLLLPLLILVLSTAVCAQKPRKQNTPQVPQKPAVTLLSVADIVGNYGLDSTWVNDTAKAMEYLNSQPQDYVALTNLCVKVRTNAQRTISSLENDYPFRDSLIWIDSSTALTDYTVYEFRLRRLADLMGRMSIQYSRLEQQRIEAEKEAARLRAIEEARRKQEELNNTASDLRSNIDLHHRAIINACDGQGIQDKAKLKELKDLYYSYLMVYNKYDLSEGNATQESIAKLDELNSFQNDLLENVLGANSLPYQIENFKNVLKVKSEDGNGDVYRSYSKVFRQTSVPIAFGDIREYEDYINRMRTLVNVQQRYVQTIELRGVIDANSDKIASTYSKKYRKIASSYRDVRKTVNTLPSFTTNAESLLFIRNLEDFIQAQQLYIDYFAQIEEFTARGDTIKERGVRIDRRLYDVVVAYREVEESLLPIPGFRDSDGAQLYQASLEGARQVQQCFLDALDLRARIAELDDSLTAARKVDRTLASGYRLLARQAVLSPSFSTIERGRSYLETLRSHIEMQELCMNVVKVVRRITSNAGKITSKNSAYRNIGKAYTRMEDSYRGVDEITNQEDLRRYSRQCDAIIKVQEAFMELMADSSKAVDADAKLKREKDISKIKLIVGIE